MSTTLSESSSPSLPVCHLVALPFLSADFLSSFLLVLAIFFTRFCSVFCVYGFTTMGIGGAIMEQRLANAWHMTVNEKKFIETALASDLRIDGRRPFDYRRLSIKFGRQASYLNIVCHHALPFYIIYLRCGVFRASDYCLPSVRAFVWSLVCSVAVTCLEIRNGRSF